MKISSKESQIEEMKLVVYDYFLEVFKFYNQVELWQFQNIHTQSVKALKIGRYNDAGEVIKAMDVMNAFERNFDAPFDYLWRPTEKQTNVLLLDFDAYIPQNIWKQKAYMNVETSPGHSHTYIVMDQQINAEKYKEIARYISKKAGSDKMAVDVTHGRRIPGIFNNKYFSTDYSKKVIIYFTTNKEYEVLNVNNVMQKINEEKEKQAKIMQMQTAEPLRKRENIFTWTEMQQRLGNEQDKSRVDFVYAMYLSKNGYTPQEIMTILMQNSPNIIQRHPKVKEYLWRTVSKAIQAQKQEVKQL